MPEVLLGLLIDVAEMWFCSSYRSTWSIFTGTGLLFVGLETYGISLRNPLSNLATVNVLRPFLREVPFSGKNGLTIYAKSVFVPLIFLSDVGC